MSEKCVDYLFERGLPKWPQMIVTGAPVSEEQALEIIRRTDDFFAYPSGNNDEFVEAAMRAMRIPRFPVGGDADAVEAYLEKKAAWEQKWQHIQTEFVTNDWISCTFVGGPHGWCHPDGQIGYSDNIGKWPDILDVYNEWAQLAKEFPFLEVEVTLMDDESGAPSIRPVASMLIRNGTVELVDPNDRNLHKEFGRTILPERDLNARLKVIFSGTNIENAIPMEQLQKWGDQIFGEGVV